MSQIAGELATWADELRSSDADRALAERSLLDTLAVALAARGHPIETIVADLDEATRWGALAHVLDFDDLHLGTTAHVSVVCATAALAAGGDEQAYLAGAGVMVRLGQMLGWTHYASGWHATCTAGAPAAAVAASVALGLNREQIARAIALAVPAAGGVQRAFGSDAKSLQVGFAISAGLRAARLAAAGASADPGVLDQWIGLVGGDANALDLDGDAVPGGLAIKIFPCCYALQRPIAAIVQLAEAGRRIDEVESIHITTPEATVQPLIHHRPMTALEGKFSLEYAIAASLIDGMPGFASFTDEAVRRPQAQALLRSVAIELEPGGDSLLSGEIAIDLLGSNGERAHVQLGDPPGAPSNPPDEAMFGAKLLDCGPDVPALLRGITWSGAAALLRTELQGAGE